MARFDKFSAEHATQTPSDVTPSKLPANGQDHEPKSKVEPVQTVSPPEEDREELSDVVDKPKKPPKKKRKTEYVDDDAKFAAMLQAEENSRARRTRGAASGKATAASRKKKRATKIKIKDAEDSDMISASGEEKKRKVNRSGAFHVRISCFIRASQVFAS
jgi:upstream activation factor subunit UAF30